MTTAADILMEARPYIDKGWCQGAVAHDASGCLVFEWDRTAVAWCVMGAVFLVGGISRVDLALGYFDRAIGNEKEIPAWNDTPGRTKDEVLDAFDRAIALALDEAAS